MKARNTTPAQTESRLLIELMNNLLIQDQWCGLVSNLDLSDAAKVNNNFRSILESGSDEMFRKSGQSAHLIRLEVKVIGMI